MEVSDLIALKIKELLDKKGISVYRLEELTGIPNSTLYTFLNRVHKTIRIENLVYICEAENLVYICEALDITLGEFFSDTRFDNVEAKDWHKNSK